MIRDAWYVVQSRPSMERSAIAGLTRLGFPSVFPILRFGRDPPRPLFARYIFARLSNDQPWREIWQLHGVSRILGGEEPTPVQDSWVERLQASLVDDVLQVGRPSDLLEFFPGDLVRVLDGVFEGRFATCVWSSVGTIVVDLMIGMLTSKVRLPASAVEHFPLRSPDAGVVLPY